MFTLFRSLKIVFQQLLKGKLDNNLEPVKLSLRVMPWDCDLNLHINNGRYLSILDLARTQLYMATGVVSLLMGRDRWGSVVVSAHIVYRRSVDIFVKYDIESRFIARTDKFIIIEHQFIVKGEISVLCYVSVAFTDNNGIVETERYIDEVGLSSLTLDEHSEDLSSYIKTNESFIDIMKKKGEPTL